MSRFDFRIYLAHAAFWLMFAAGHLAARYRFRCGAPASAPNTQEPGKASMRAPRANLLIGVHMVAFGLMYTSVGNAVFGAGMPKVPSLVRAAGALTIYAGGGLMCWARLAFASWRFGAQIDSGHQLATGGPFRVIRHPLYAGMDLLALGTALWIPTPLVWLGTILMAVAGDLRARAEEVVLERAFGDTYRHYRHRTHRFIPGLY